MSLMGEHLAEEWLNRQGFFTIRGIKVGTGEIDLLAVRPKLRGVECWHYEVQVSLRPVSYICPAPASQRRKGVAPYNAKIRPNAHVRKAVKEWVRKKYLDPKKVDIRKSLCARSWNFGLIVGNVKFREELSLIEQEGIKIIRIADILKAIGPKWSSRGTDYPVGAAAGADLVDLIFAKSQMGVSEARHSP